ncbi:GATOR1 complex protein DEPDC5-like isoform X2 [Ptychodera flava]|uniref:GATOR1 complex protein DEPDC5-like isoform X2 n=1 Tax=Ptychodera flava TaxID=63121 RepID=UPI00396A60DB
MNSNQKQVKLLVHQKTFSEDELILNPKEFPHARVGDIVEIYHPDSDDSRLLLQVKSLKESKQSSTKESVSVDQSIASAFNLRTYQNVIVNIVNPETVTLDLLELTFKDQYISRSDMWRLKTSLIDSCAYITRKVEFSGVRAQISELWAKGEKVTCGVISADTKVVFRSSTAMIYLFLQMSSEMWEFDVYGDLHLEKAIEFLTELFTRWKEGNNYHDITIVLFSRTFYRAKSIEEFPLSARDCLRKDYRGRYYEDFYRIVAIAERRDDWRPFLVTLKKVFNEYPSKVLRTEVDGEPCPRCYNSTSVQGNFLEAINLSLNVFDKHFINRNFDRTGQMAIVITPGAGVFDVDRELCNITKQRMIDNGIGSDLVCMAEQPLHAAPLFKFHNKMGSTDIGDDYNIPYWINHSFYTTKDQQRKTKMIPRIKLAEKITTDPASLSDTSLYEHGDNFTSTDSSDFPEIVDHNAYDAQVFRIPSYVKCGRPRQYLTPKRFTKYTDRFKKSEMHMRKHSLELQPVSSDIDVPHKSLSSNAVQIPMMRPRSNTVTDNSRGYQARTPDCMSKSLHNHSGSRENDDYLPTRAIVGSASMVSDHQYGKPYANGQRPQRALINPFAPSQIIDRLTSNKRRWTHTFPLGPSGKAMQAHHQQTVALLDDINIEPCDLSVPTREVTAAASAVIEARKKANVSARFSDSDTLSANDLHSSTSTSSLSSAASQLSTSSESLGTVRSRGSVINMFENDNRGRSETLASHHPSLHGQSESFKNITEGWYWGVTGEQEWSPLLQTGVDWKSLTWPACLPITTDYLPDLAMLAKTFVESTYDLLADEVVIGSKTLTTDQVFLEIVSQRLMQGCQLIVLPQSQKSTPVGSRPFHALNFDQEMPEYWVSIGRNYHRINLAVDQNINVIRYRPRYITQAPSVNYTYRLWPVDKIEYEPADVVFRHERLEEFNWNYLDNYVCDSQSFSLMESLKYWRSRFLLLPSNSAATKKINEGCGEKCDIYLSSENLEGFLRFVEVLNRIRRSPASRKKKLQAPDSQPPSRPPSRKASSAMLSNLPQGLLDKETASKDTPQTPKSSHSSVLAAASSEVATVTMSYADSSTPSNESISIALTSAVDKEDGAKDDEEKLTLESPLQDFIKAMKDSSCGMTFLPCDQRALPEYTFVSAEAVSWMMQTLQGDIKEHQAVGIFQTMVESGFIVHASCLQAHPFVNGFFLYFIIPEDSSLKDLKRRYTAFDTFETDWFEVAVESGSESQLEEQVYDISYGSTFGWRSNQLREPSSYRLKLLKDVLLDVDINNKSNRVEWCHVCYYGMYKTDSAFQLEVQWLVATGCLVMDMVQSWARKAGGCGFHLIPATIDPFGHNALFWDPLRCPLFIQLQCDHILEDTGTDVDVQRIEFFQREILKAFGFMRDSKYHSTSYGNRPEASEQYVHVSGTAFTFIPDRRECKTREGLPQRRLGVARNYETSQPGFYWMNNFMLTKRWRSASTGDEKFCEKLLSDFKQFCADKDGRLSTFWNHLSTPSHQTNKPEDHESD